MKNKFTITDYTTEIKTNMFYLNQVVEMLNCPVIDAELFLVQLSCISKYYDLFIDNNQIFIIDKS